MRADVRPCPHTSQSADTHPWEGHAPLGEATPFQGGQFLERDFPVSGSSSSALRAGEPFTTKGDLGPMTLGTCFRAAGTSDKSADNTVAPE